VAASLLLAGMVVVDGIAMEARHCAIICGNCGADFEAPWRPNP
jgi:hypothetical protein